MPCEFCGARQDDPAQGPSPWKRGVIASEQVLICPTCQQEHGAAGLDTCPHCGSARLSKALGIVRCSACGWSGDYDGSAADR